MCSTRALAALAMLAAASTVSALPVCGTDGVFDVTGTPLLPFGGEIIGASILEGTIVGARLDVTFTATGSFDAANLGVSFVLPVNGDSAGTGFTGASLGWSGQGTFTASLPTDNLNGDLAITGGGFYTWLALVSNLNVGAGPISGTLDDLRLTLTMAPCPTGDINGDIRVDAQDFLILIGQWGQTEWAEDEPCADVNTEGVVDALDFLEVIGNWGNYFCPAPLC